MQAIIKDARKGPWCKINGKYAYEEFGADLKEITSGQENTDISYVKSVGKSSLKMLKNDFPTKIYDFVFYVTGCSEEQCELNCSSLLEECRECIITTGDNDFEYVGALTKFRVRKTGIEWYNEVEISLVAVKRLHLERIKVTRIAEVILNKGAQTGLRIVVKANDDVSEITVANIKMQGLSKNSEFIIDGIEGKVLYNGANALLKTNLVSFPKLNHGYNKVFVSSLANVEIVLEYYPTLVA